MSILKTKDLLGQLSKLERSVKEFSFEELSAVEAKELQRSFNVFRSSLENHIYAPDQARKSDSKLQEVVRPEKEIDFQSQIIAKVRSEIRTPLNSIIGYTNLLRAEKLNEDQQKKVRAIQFASTSLLKIVNEVLEYSNSSSGSNHFETIDFKLRGLLNDIMYLSKTLIIDQGIELIIEIEDQVPETIKGDPSKLSQVLLNLLGNSIKFVHQGHIKLKVSLVEYTSKDCVLEFTVSDTGIGIPKSKLNTIFESYGQGGNDTFVKQGGPGLGLSSTRQIIKKQQGEIKIFSEVGSGTAITFRLPYSIGNSMGLQEINTKGIDTKRGKKKFVGTELLVFEDNRMNQDYIGEQLTKWGCKVYTHVNFKKGLALLAIKKMDMVLLNLKMPNLNGFEISKSIRAHKNCQINTVPIIAIGADFTEQDRKACKSLGINDFLLEPYTLDELLNTIMKHKRNEPSPKDANQLLQKKMIQSKETTIIDLDPILKDCFGELDMLKELIRLFKGNVLEFVGNVKIHLETNDLTAIAFSAHKLKASFAMLKANGMRELIIELEAKSKANKPFEVKELYHVFLEDYPVLEQNLDKQLALLNEK